MPSQHKHRPIPFRPPEGDRARLLALAERTAQPVNRILSEALAAYLNAAESTANCEDRPRVS
jgi:predicted DNA-binding protein